MAIDIRTRPSCFMITKGALVEATYRAFESWNLNESMKSNIKRIRETNYIGAPSIGWLKDFGKVLNRRFDSVDRDKTLIDLVQVGYPIEKWKPLLLWHMAQSDDLVYDFFTIWLYDQLLKGIVQLQSTHFLQFLRDYHDQYVDKMNLWSETTIKSAAAGLAKIPADFGILTGKRIKVFTSYRLPDESFLYLVYALMERERSAKKVIDSTDWHLFMMDSRDVENELYRLHQYRKVEYEVAGSLVQLKLPYASLTEYIGRMKS